MPRSQNQYERPPAVVIGDNINALGLIRCLGREGIPVISVVGKPTPHTGRSRYPIETIAWPWPYGAGLLDVLGLIAKSRPGKKILFATSDSHVKTIAEHRDQIDPSYQTSVPDSDVALKLVNKVSFLEAAKAVGCSLPEFGIARSAAELTEVAAAVGFPCVVKPHEKCDRFECLYGAKALICHSPEDAMKVACADYDYKTPLMVQHFVPGGDGDIYFTFHYFNQKCEQAIAFSGRKIRQIPPILGHSASAEPVDLPDLIAESERFFRSVGFSGLCSMEYKRSPEGIFYMIEPTVGRTNWHSALADINGVPILSLAYSELAGLPLPEIRRRKKAIRWVDFEGDYKSAMYYIGRNELSLIAWLRSIRSFRPAVLSIRDPLPGILYGLSLLRRAWTRLASVLCDVFGK